MGKFEFFLVQAVLLVPQVVECCLGDEGLHLASLENLIISALGRLLDVLFSTVLEYVENIEVFLLQVDPTAALETLTDSLLVLLDVLGPPVKIIKYHSHEPLLARG